MRNISFAMTVDQIGKRTKTVTRRTMWSWLKPGDELQACVKCMGLKKGEKIEKLCVIVVTDVRREPLSAMNVEPYGTQEAIKEGFTNMPGWAFVNYFCDNMKCTPETIVTRIEFKYQELVQTAQKRRG